MSQKIIPLLFSINISPIIFLFFGFYTFLLQNLFFSNFAEKMKGGKRKGKVRCVSERKADSMEMEGEPS